MELLLVLFNMITDDNIKSLYCLRSTDYHRGDFESEIS